MKVIIFMHTLILRTGHFFESDSSAISAELSCETPACTVDAQNVEINFYIAQVLKAQSVSNLKGVVCVSACVCARACVQGGVGATLSPPFLFYLPQCLDIFLLAVLTPDWC